MHTLMVLSLTSDSITTTRLMIHECQTALTDVALAQWLSLQT